ncbi:integration host factor subunit beta [Zoogloea ramigera]|uniref:Integration host factor subunit beta n=1 Tax=Zoogloea ramigera TaxID=350 RepID=A0A4Y4CSE5_ZOORA|nr:integration host factor subunit beta [Zoogloea ramigera]GEC95828.1 integration host factor subunit beta [Zoogloea ramigera]
MTRSDLIERLSSTFPTLTAADVTAAAKVILKAMADTLEEGGRIEIRGFGSFSTNVRPPRLGRNPKTGVTVDVPAKRAINFKPGLELRERVDFSRT